MKQSEQYVLNYVIRKSEGVPVSFRILPRELFPDASLLFGTDTENSTIRHGFYFNDSRGIGDSNDGPFIVCSTFLDIDRKRKHLSDARSWLIDQELNCSSASPKTLRLNDTTVRQPKLELKVLTKNLDSLYGPSVVKNLFQLRTLDEIVAAELRKEEERRKGEEFDRKAEELLASLPRKRSASASKSWEEEFQDGEDDILQEEEEEDQDDDLGEFNPEIF
jgi:hypothetical protein